MSELSAGRLQLLAAALLFSTGGAAIKATTLTPWQVAGFRSGIAALALWLWLPQARRLPNPRLLGVSLAYAATVILFVLANKLTTSANAIFLQDTAPLYLLLIGPWWLREPVRRRDLWLMALMISGMSLFFLAEQQPLRTAPDPARGNVVAVASGLTWALTIGGLRWLETRAGQGSGLATVAAGNLLAFLICMPLALPAAGVTAQDWLCLAYLGVFQIGLAYVLLTRGMRRVRALEASLLLLAEPALNPIWTWFIHGEQPVKLAWVGGAMILTGTTLKALENT